MENPKTIKSRFALPLPLHTWPRSVKRVVLVLVTVACIGIYVLLITAIVSLLILVWSLVV